MSARVVAVIQARQGSARLPGKSLRPLAGRPLIAHVIERVAACPGIHDAVLATTDRPEDEQLSAVAAGTGLLAHVVRGDATDVLDRMRFAARLAKADAVVRVTGDCPLWAPDVGAAAVTAWRENRTAYVWNDTARSGYPDGVDVEVFSRDLLELAAHKARRADDREHVTAYIRRTTPTVVRLTAVFDYSWLKLSVDTADDLARVQRVVAEIPRGDLSLSATIAAAAKVCRRPT